MRRFFSSAVALGALTLSAAEPSINETVTVRAVRLAMPSVVRIQCYSQKPGRDRVMHLGAGTLIDPRGLVLTNDHVVAHNHDHEVFLDKETEPRPARLIARAPKSDLALLRIFAPEPLVAMRTGSSAALQLGDTLLVIGNPLGTGTSVTRGILSQRHTRFEFEEDRVFENLLQTDASINPGNSGGPMVNLSGEIVGVNWAVRANAQGIGYALPIDEARGVLASMLSGRRHHSRHLGVVFAGHGSRGAALEVVAVERNSPASAMGLKRGGVLLKAGKIPVKDEADLELALLDKEIGEKLIFEVEVDGKVSLLEGALGTAPPLSQEAKAEVLVVGRLESAQEYVWRRLGVSFTDEERTDVPKPYHGGIEVEKVRMGSFAQRAGLKTNDIVVEFRKLPVLGLKELEQAVRRAADAKVENAFIISRGNELFRTGLQPKQFPGEK